jgi:hypothetical protein
MDSTSVVQLEEDVTKLLSELSNDRDSIEQAHLHVEEVENMDVLVEKQDLSTTVRARGTWDVVCKKSNKRHRPQPQSRPVLRRHYAKNVGREELQRLAAVPSTTYCELLRAASNVLPSWAQASSSVDRG